MTSRSTSIDAKIASAKTQLEHYRYDTVYRELDKANQLVEASQLSAAEKNELRLAIHKLRALTALRDHNLTSHARFERAMDALREAGCDLLDCKGKQLAESMGKGGDRQPYQYG